MKDNSEDMTFKVLRGLTLEEAIELTEGIDVEHLKGNIQGMADLLDPILKPYNWSVIKIIVETVKRHQEKENGKQSD